MRQKTDKRQCEEMFEKIVKYLMNTHGINMKDAKGAIEDSRYYMLFTSNPKACCETLKQTGLKYAAQEVWKQHLDWLDILAYLSEPCPEKEVSK